ncbi:hypothetical protein L1987_65107 [Smallanthus sonchifolius]|uniref:Uncharacterized protein n=1 Tax=Smallanthus sonchifolius TaxID=185202 RepID=A0ACB9BTG5_9ASTR|nr:hypothetical protein L1987_65107 [Smallanthus sonchifolius]
MDVSWLAWKTKGRSANVSRLRFHNSAMTEKRVADDEDGWWQCSLGATGFVWVKASVEMMVSIFVTDRQRRRSTVVVFLVVGVIDGGGGVLGCRRVLIDGGGVLGCRIKWEMILFVLAVIVVKKRRYEGLSYEHQEDGYGEDSSARRPPSERQQGGYNRRGRQGGFQGGQGGYQSGGQTHEGRDRVHRDRYAGGGSRQYYGEPPQHKSRRGTDPPHRHGGSEPSYSGGPSRPSIPDLYQATQAPQQPVTTMQPMLHAETSSTCQIVDEPVEPCQQVEPVQDAPMRLPLRPGKGSKGTRLIVKANHFFAQLPDKDLHQYDVTITPEVTSRGVNRAVIQQLVKLYRDSHLGKRLPAYDGRKNLYTAGPFPFVSREFKITLRDEEDGSCRRDRDFKVVIKLVSRADLHHLERFLAGRQADAPRDAIMVLDIVLRELPINRYFPVGQSFYSPNLGRRQSLNMSSTAFIEPLPVVDFITQLLNRDVSARPLSDSDLLKIKKSLRGVRVEVTHRGNMRRKHIISGLTSQTTQELKFPVDDRVGNAQRVIYLPMEVCKIVEGQRWSKSLNERQITALLKVTCQRPREREQDILKTLSHNAYGQDPYAKEFGIKISTELTSVEARLKYHDAGRERDCLPQVGQWNMMNKKMINGGTVASWICINFSRDVQDKIARAFCSELAQMCNISGMEFNPDPVLPILSGRPDQAERIIVKVGGRNTVLADALSRCIPNVSDVPTVIFGADVTHPHRGEDSSPSIAAVVASQDWPEITKYVGLVCAQAHREELIQDLFKEWQDPDRGKVSGGMVKDGVSEGQFYQVLLYELDAIRKACASLEPNYQPPVTFVVVQKRHHTRLFASNHRDCNSVDRSGNILPGTVVDSKISHPTEFDFYLCSHAGIQVRVMDQNSQFGPLVLKKHA